MGYECRNSHRGSVTDKGNDFISYYQFLSCFLVGDEVAQEFLTSFLKAFVGGKSLYQSVRDAREQLHHWENRFPCST